MMIGRSARVFVSAMVVLLAMSGNVAAQSNDEIFPQFQWNFSTPGARANGMGRAFIGMADDATATITNPAGLVTLTKPQVYFEIKNTNLQVNRLAAADSFTTLNTTTFSKSLNSLSFFSVSSPIGSRLAVGLTVHQFLNYQEDFQLEPRPIPGSPNGSVFRSVNGSADFKGTTIGFTASAAVNPKINLGVTVAANRLSAESLAKRNRVFFDPIRDSGILGNQTLIDETANGLSFSWGLLIKPNEKVSIGFEHVVGPKFDISENQEINPGQDAGVNSTPVQATGFPVAVTIDVPNRFGGGVAVRPNAHWTFAFDAVHIQYSSLANDFALVFGSDVLSADQYSVDDVTETHLGAEYSTTFRSTPVFLRAGLFTNPNHTLRFEARTQTTLDGQNNDFGEQAKYNLLPRATDVRGTVGAGFVFGQRMQLDLAYVLGRELVVSTAIRFR